MNKNLKKKYVYLLIFLIPVLILVLVYAVRKVFPFGTNSVLVLDLNAQYIYFYETFRDAVLGDKSLLYSFGRTLGGEFVGIYAYYLASPFSLILLIFPRELITEAVLVMILMKTGTASLTFSIFLRKTRNASNAEMILFSLMYGLMSYAMVQTMNPMWLDGLILLPLIILFTERFVDNCRFIGLVVTLALLFIAHFYIGYMTAIFVFIYFLYYMFGKGSIPSTGMKIKKTLSFMGFGLIAAGISAFLLLPTIFSLGQGKLTFTDPSFVPIQKAGLIDIFTKLLPMTYDSINYPGFPFIFAGTLVLLLVPIYFINKNIKPRAKAAAGAFIGFMVVCFMVSTLDVVLHGFQFPNWLNFRYSFVMSFFLLMLSYDGYKNLGDIKTKHIASIALILVILIAITEKLGYGYIRPETGVWPAYALIVVFASIFSLSKGESKRKILLLILTVLVAAEMGFNAFFIFKGAHEEVYYSDRPSYRDYFDRLYPLVEYMEDHDDEFYRSETVIRRTVNDPMALGINGVSNSTSTLNASVISMLHKLGLASQEHWTRYKGTTPLTDSILGIKYIISESMPNNLYKQVYSENDLVLYENPDALPVAFPCSMEVSGLVLDSIDPFINQNALLSTMLGEQYTEYFKLVNIREIVFENITASQQDGFVAYAPVVPGLNAHIEYILEPVKDNEIYMYLHSPYPRKANIWLNRSQYIDTFWDYSSHCIMPLGSHEGEETISLITTPIESDYYLSNNMFYYLDKPVYEEAIGRLSSDETAVQRISETRLMINVNAGKDDILFTTIPYEKGWHIKANGETVKPIEILDSLMAVELNEGTNTVEMRFIPPGLVAGAIISMVSILLLVIFACIYKRKEKHIEGALEKPET